MTDTCKTSGCANPEGHGHVHSNGSLPRYGHPLAWSTATTNTEKPLMTDPQEQAEAARIGIRYWARHAISPGIRVDSEAAYEALGVLLEDHKRQAATLAAVREEVGYEGTPDATERAIRRILDASAGSEAPTPNDPEREGPRRTLLGAATCSCGHRLAIHEYPYGCRGGVSYPDEMVACDCRIFLDYGEIAADRAVLEVAELITDEEINAEAERIWPLDREYSPHQTRAVFSVRELDAYCVSAFTRGATWAVKRSVSSSAADSERALARVKAEAIREVADRIEGEAVSREESRPDLLVGLGRERAQVGAEVRELRRFALRLRAEADRVEGGGE